MVRDRLAISFIYKINMCTIKVKEAIRYSFSILIDFKVTPKAAGFYIHMGHLNARQVF